MEDSLHQAAEPADVVPLKNCIRVLNGFGRSLEVILPKLRDGYITSDAKIARNLALGNPDSYFLSSAGECFHNVTVTGGKQRSEGPLSLKRELREVARLAGEMEAAIQNDQNKIQTLARELAEQPPSNPTLIENVLEFYKDLNQAFVTKKHAAEWRKTVEAIEKLRASAKAQ